MLGKRRHRNSTSFKTQTSLWSTPRRTTRDGQPTYSDAAVQTCLTMKVLFGIVLLQTTGFVDSLLRLIGLD